MNRRSRKAALEIRLLLEEYSSEELAEALSLLGAQKDEDLIVFLTRTAGSSSDTRHTPSPSKRRGLSTNGETKALQALKHSDPEKYRVLNEFEGRIREGAVLSSLDDFRAFAKVLGKDYEPAKSRREALGQLIALLAGMDLSAIQVAIAKVPAGIAGREGAFGRLAEHIITGGEPRPPER